MWALICPILAAMIQSPTLPAQGIHALSCRRWLLRRCIVETYDSPLTRTDAQPVDPDRVARCKRCAGELVRVEEDRDV